MFNTAVGYEPSVRRLIGRFARHLIRSPQRPRHPAHLSYCRVSARGPMSTPELEIE